VSDRIEISGIRAFAHIGFAHELQHPQLVVVDVELELDTRKASASDDLADTIDYALVAQETQRAVEHETYSLLETLADALAKRFVGFGAERAIVRVSKPQAALALGAEEIAVTVERP
jgi:7,8-dihydroneopterin aldolase/epimerase/oxygenase